jgi:hypothetical protein
LTSTSDSHPPECVIPDDVLIQFGPPDDEHLLLETCRGIKINTLKKECVKLVINKNYVQMHRQQNIKGIILLVSYNSHTEGGFLPLQRLRTSLFKAITLQSQYRLSINFEILNLLES